MLACKRGSEMSHGGVDGYDEVSSLTIAAVSLKSVICCGAVSTHRRSPPPRSDLQIVKVDSVPLYDGLELLPWDGA